MFFNQNKIVKKLGKEVNKSLPIISICDLNRDLCLELEKQFDDIDQVEIVNGDLFKIKADAIVSPANSFGDMSGGIDKKIDEHFKGKAQSIVMNKIRQEYYGELPVGSVMIIPMSQGKYPYLIVAPTMRIPGRLSENSINVYLAMRGILSQVLRYNESNNGGIKRLLIPGLGTGVGGFNYAASAQQMCTAYRNIFGGKWKEIVHPALAPYNLKK